MNIFKCRNEYIPLPKSALLAFALNFRNGKKIPTAFRKKELWIEHGASILKKISNYPNQTELSRFLTEKMGVPCDGLLATTSPPPAKIRRIDATDEEESRKHEQLNCEYVEVGGFLLNKIIENVDFEKDSEIPTFFDDENMWLKYRKSSLCYDKSLLLNNRLGKFLIEKGWAILEVSDVMDKMMNLARSPDFSDEKILEFLLSLDDLKFWSNESSKHACMLIYFIFGETKLLEALLNGSHKSLKFLVDKLDKITVGLLLLFAKSLCGAKCHCLKNYKDHNMLKYVLEESEECKKKLPLLSNFLEKCFLKFYNTNICCDVIRKIIVKNLK